MTELTSCPDCGTNLPTDAPAGLCPACLLEQGLNDSDGHFSGDSPAMAATLASPPGAFVPPAVEQLAPLFPQLEIVELIGHGGMGAVYKARQTKLDRLVALKIIRPESAADAAFAERFNREARTLARLDHPGIVGVHDFGEVVAQLAAAPHSARPPAPTYYFLMEFVDGANIRQVIESGDLSATQAVSVVSQVCEALQFAHDEGIVHRDIKPENILLDRKGRVKIADFGLARLGATTPDNFTLTGTHQIMGTPRYMSPEQMDGSRTVDHRADIYSLGVVFYEMLTGEVPMGSFVPPSQKASVDQRLDEVVLRALAREPERRYQQATDIRAAVDQISHSAVELASVVAASEPITPRKASVTTILEVGAKDVWNWVGSTDETDDRSTRFPRWPMLLLCLVAFVLLMLPWVDVKVTDAAVTRGLTETQLTTIDGVPTHVITTRGIDRVCGLLAAGALVLVTVLVMMQPTHRVPSRASAVLLTAVTVAAATLTLLVTVEDSHQLIRVYGDEATGQLPRNSLNYDGVSGMASLQSVERTTQYLPAFCGFAATLLALTVLGASSLRHQRPRSSTPLAEVPPQAHRVTQRFSRKAIVGACMIPLSLILMALGTLPWLVVRTATTTNGTTAAAAQGTPNTWIMLFAFALGLTALASPFVTTLLGILAMFDIRRSQGRLVGFGLAFIDAVFFPCLLTMVLVFWFAWALTAAFRIDDSERFGAMLLIGLPLYLLLVWLILGSLWRATNPRQTTIRDRTVPPDHAATTRPTSSAGSAIALACLFLLVTALLATGPFLIYMLRRSEVQEATSYPAPPVERSSSEPAEFDTTRPETNSGASTSTVPEIRQ